MGDKNSKCSKDPHNSKTLTQGMDILKPGSGSLSLMSKSKTRLH